MVRPRRHRQRQDVVPKNHPGRRLLPRDRRHGRTVGAANDSVVRLARAPADDCVRRPPAAMHRHGSSAARSLAHREPRRPRLLAAVGPGFGVPAGLPSPEHPEAAPSPDPDERPAGAVHQEGLAAAPAAVVVDAERHAAVRAVHRAAVAVEHQRLHPHRVHLLSLNRGGGRRRRRGCGQRLDLGHGEGREGALVALLSADDDEDGMLLAACTWMATPYIFRRPY